MKFIADYPLLFTVLTTIVVMACMFAIDIKLNKKPVTLTEENETKEPVKEVKHTPNTSYTQLMEILNNTIERELYFWLKLTVDMMDVKIIDFDETLDSISRRIYNALSPEFISDLMYYHDERWIMEFIVRTVKIYVTDYIRKHPVS